MRLIDADALIDALNISDEDIIFKEILEDEPTIDAVPVRHGHWIKITPSGIHECSMCGKYVMTCDIEEYKYCHRCGARMDGDNNAFI